jgi:hypothetical protein
MYRRYWFALLILALVTPLGLIADGTAWGEWGTEDMEKLVGFVPRGLEQAAAWWQALFPDYAVKGLGEGRMAESAGYILSAFIGAGAVYALMMIYIRLIARPK